MPNTHEIVLPFGNRIGVLVKNLPKKLAEAIYPREIGISPLVSRIRGKLPDREPLTSEDWRLLRSLWPSVQEVMPHKEFCNFSDAFRQWPDKPRWQVWSEDEGGDKLAGLRKDAKEMFKARVDEAVASGTLVPRNHAGIPTCPNDASYTPGLAWIFPPELEAFAANFHIRVCIAELKDSQRIILYMSIALHDFVGYSAAILTTVAFVPQALTSWRTRDLSGVSLPMYSIFTAGVAMWLAYGVMLGSWPIIIANTITLALSGTVLALKVMHR
jgi:MtN3 and saliva related transmembrane protein